MASITLKEVLDLDSHQGPFPFQQPAVDLCVSAFRGNRSIAIQGPGGSGKTFVIACALKEAQEKNLIYSNEDVSSFQACSILIFTAKQIRIQFQRDLKKVGVKNTMVFSLGSSVRGEKLSLFLKWEERLDSRGNPYDRCVWDIDSAPDLLVVDECQMVRNYSSKSAEVIKAFRRQFPARPIVFMSATMFSRFSEARTVLEGIKFTSDYAWTATCREFCGWRSPEDFHPSIMTNLRNRLVEENLLADLGNVIYPKKAVVQSHLVQFETEKQRIFYHETEKRMLEEFEKAQRMPPRDRVNYIRVLILKFRMAAEILKSGLLARKADEIVKQFNKQVVIATNFVGTRQAVRKILTKKLGVDPDRICEITGQQTDEKRQEQIDKWQNGQADYMLLSMKLGVGINLHHDRKCSRPRHVILPATWSVFEAIQTLARAHRLTSRSTTYEDILVYAGTIEERVKSKQDLKKSSLRALMTSKADLFDVFDEWKTRDLKELKDEFSDNDEDGVSLLENESIADNVVSEEPKQEQEENILL